MTRVSSVILLAWARTGSTLTPSSSRVVAPKVLLPDADWPIARWLGPRYGAVRALSRFVDEDGTDAYDDETWAYERSGTGWREIGQGGSGGAFEDLRRTYLARPVVTHLAAGLCVTWPGGGCATFAGQASIEAYDVVVEDADGAATPVLLSPLGYMRKPPARRHRLRPPAAFRSPRRRQPQRHRRRRRR